MATYKGKLALREEVMDTITGYSGVVIGVTFWLNGCVRVGVQTKEMKDGKPIDPEWFDDQQLESIAKPEKPAEKKRGGPMPDPKR